MADAVMTLAGLYNYDQTIFDDLILPVKPTPAMMGIQQDQFIDDDMLPYVQINKETLIGKLMLDTAAFSIMYMSGATMKMAIRLWSKSKLPSWQALYNTLFFKYNPLWNKDAYHTESASRQGAKRGENAVSAMGRYETEQASNDRNTSYVKGYDEGGTNVYVSTAYPSVPPMGAPSQVDDKLSTTENTQNESFRLFHEQVQKLANNSAYNPNIDVSLPHNASGDNLIHVTPSGVEDGAMVQHGGGTNSSGKAGNFKETDSGSEQVTWTEHGNIGVTMTQELIEKARKLALFNLYDAISDDFIKHFCLMVY